MRPSLTDLIPEFKQIQDEDLRRKAIAVWQEAMELGGWTLESLQELPYTLLVEDVDISFPTHVRVVCRLCLCMAEVLIEAYGDRYEVDTDTLLAGALLADVGKLLEFNQQGDSYEWAEMYDYLRHPFTGVGLCFKHDVPPAVMHLVATHSWEGDRFKRRPEAVILHHADFTDFDLSRAESK